MAADPEYAFLARGQMYRLQIRQDALTSSVADSLAGLIGADPSTFTLSSQNVDLAHDSVFTSHVQTGHPVIVTFAGEGDSDDDPDEEEEAAILSDDQDDAVLGPPDLDRRIDEVLERCEGWAFTREDCERALALAFFNCELAAQWLRAGDVPGSADEAMARISGAPPDPHEIDKQNIARLFDETRLDVPMLVQYYDACGKDYERTLQCIRGE
jgi:hypothetical protein